MPMSLIVNCTLGAAANTVDGTLAAPADQIFTQQGGLYQMPRRLKVLGVCAAIADPVRLRLDVPSLRAITLPNMDPLNPALPLANRPGLWWPGAAGPYVEATEEYRLLYTRGGAAAGDCYAASWLSDTVPSATGGHVLTLYATSAVATNNGVWGFGPLTLDTRLPPGTYDIVGVQTYGVNVFASRFIFADRIERPGNIARPQVGTWNDDDVRRGRLGVLGSFTNFTVPNIEIFGYGVTTTQVHHIDVIKR